MISKRDPDAKYTIESLRILPLSEVLGLKPFYTPSSAPLDP